VWSWQLDYFNLALSALPTMRDKNFSRIKKPQNARRSSSVSIVLSQQFLSFSCSLSEGIISLNCCHRFCCLIKMPLGVCAAQSYELLSSSWLYFPWWQFNISEIKKIQLNAANDVLMQALTKRTFEIWTAISEQVSS
jgi:hypothetical protein